MTNAMPAWSYSSLNNYETCPRKYYLTRVAKKIIEPQGEAAKYGDDVHKALELSVVNQQPLPDKYSTWQPIASKVMSAKGKRSAELKLAINKSFQPVSWFDKTAWCRGIVDIVVENNVKAWAGDWKTGKRKPESTQLMLFAGLLFHHKPYLEHVTTSFIWLKDSKIDTEKFDRGSIGNIWQEFMPRVQRMQASYENDKWVPKPSGLCGWCPVGKDNCEFWRERR